MWYMEDMDNSKIYCISYLVTTTTETKNISGESSSMAFVNVLELAHS